MLTQIADLEFPNNTFLVSIATGAVAGCWFKCAEGQVFKIFVTRVVIVETRKLCGWMVPDDGREPESVDGSLQEEELPVFVFCLWCLLFPTWRPLGVWGSLGDH